MARIRSIKPEFWTSEQVVECSPTARLLFVGLWNFCDDAGRHPASARRLQMEVFPADPFTGDEVRAMVDELIAAGLVVEYSVENQRFWQVTGWQHQKIDKPTVRYPGPEIRRALPEDSASTPREVPEASPPEWKGVDKESSGREKRSVPDNQRGAALKTDGTGADAPGSGSEKPNGAGKAVPRTQIQAVYDDLNERTGRTFKPTHPDGTLTACGQYVRNLFRKGYSLQDFLIVNARQCREWGDDPKMSKHLAPDTLYRPANFAKYRGMSEQGGSASA